MFDVSNNRANAISNLGEMGKRMMRYGSFSVVNYHYYNVMTAFNVVRDRRTECLNSLRGG